MAFKFSPSCPCCSRDLFTCGAERISYSMVDIIGIGSGCGCNVSGFMTECCDSGYVVPCTGLAAYLSNFAFGCVEVSGIKYPHIYLSGMTDKSGYIGDSFLYGKPTQHITPLIYRVDVYSSGMDVYDASGNPIQIYLGEFHENKGLSKQAGLSVMGVSMCESNKYFCCAPYSLNKSFSGIQIYSNFPGGITPVRCGGEIGSSNGVDTGEPADIFLPFTVKGTGIIYNTCVVSGFTINGGATTGYSMSTDWIAAGNCTANLSGTDVGGCTTITNLQRTYNYQYNLTCNAGCNPQFFISAIGTVLSRIECNPGFWELNQSDACFSPNLDCFCNSIIPPNPQIRACYGCSSILSGHNDCTSTTQWQPLTSDFFPCGTGDPCHFIGGYSLTTRGYGHPTCGDSSLLMPVWLSGYILPVGDLATYLGATGLYYLKSNRNTLYFLDTWASSSISGYAGPSGGLTYYPSAFYLYEVT